MKNALAYMSPETAVSLVESRIVAAGDDHWIAATPAGGTPAVCAASCLLRPRVGDLVLLSRSAGGAYILAVLAQAGGETALDLHGDVRVNVASGHLTVSAAGGVNVASAQGIAMTAPHIQTDAGRGSFRIGTLEFTASRVAAVCDTLSLAARAVDHAFRRLVQRLGSAFRYVEGHDEMQAASARQLVDGTLTIQTENTVHLAEQHIKIDAEQVHLG